MNARPKILFVEDDTALQRQLRWSFPQYEVLIAANRAAALRTVQASHPEVVLLDLGLPPEPNTATEGWRRSRRSSRRRRPPRSW
jgi:two-component system NtrC family response regulator